MIGAIWNHVWQSTLFLAAAWAVTGLLRQHTARIRYRVWFAASLKFLVPWSALVAFGDWMTPAHSLQIDLASQPLIAAAASLVDLGAHPTANAFGPYVSAFLILVWASGAGVCFTRWFLCWSRARRSVESAQIHLIDAPIEVRSRISSQSPACSASWSRCSCCRRTS